MTSNEIIEKLDLLVEIENKYPNSFELITDLGKRFIEVGDSINDVLGVDDLIDEEDLRKKVKFSRKTLIPIIQYLKSKRIGVIFIDLNNLIKELDKMITLLPSFPSIESSTIKRSALSELHQSLNSFYSLYEESVGNFSYSNTYNLSRIAYIIKKQLTVINEIAKTFKIMLLSQPEVKTGEQELSLYFTAPIKYDELIKKLVSIEELYNEICRLFVVSTSEYPLQIAKLEVGSWWIKIFGESKVIALITSLIEKSVSYLHQNFTQQGQIQEIPKNVEVINKLIDLKKSLQENGIDTKVLEENIQRSAIVVSNQLNTLLVGEPNVKVNDKKYYLGEELDEKLLQEKRTLQLEAKNPDPSEDNNSENE